MEKNEHILVFLTVVPLSTFASVACGMWHVTELFRGKAETRCFDLLQFPFIPWFLGMVTNYVIEDFILECANNMS